MRDQRPGTIVPRGSSPDPGACRLNLAHAVLERSNIASHLSAMACRQPHTMAVVVPSGRDRSGRVRYTHLTYRQLDRDSEQIARGLKSLNIARGSRAVVMVRPGL